MNRNIAAMETFNRQFVSLTPSQALASSSFNRHETSSGLRQETRPSVQFLDRIYPLYRDTQPMVSIQR